MMRSTSSPLRVCASGPAFSKSRKALRISLWSSLSRTMASVDMARRVPARSARMRRRVPPLPAVLGATHQAQVLELGEPALHGPHTPAAVEQRGVAQDRVEVLHRRVGGRVVLVVGAGAA